MARIYLPSSAPDPDAPKPGRAGKDEANATTQPESTPQGSIERTVDLAEPAAATPPPANASKAEWVEYAVTYRGADQADAEALTRNVLAEKYGRAPEGDRNG